MNQKYGSVIKEIKPQASLSFDQGYNFAMLFSGFLQVIPILVTLYIGSISSIRWLAICFIVASIVLLFILLRELYGNLKVPYSLEYVITEKGILYKWQDFGQKEFFIPYILIGDVKLIEYDNSDKSVILFQGCVEISNYKSSFLTDQNNGLLCFNNLSQEETQNSFEIFDHTP